jgi:hypothetical protein
VDDHLNTPDHFEVKLEDVSVYLVNFSIGDLYVLSKVPFSPGPIKVSVEFKDGGGISLPGNVVRVVESGDMWGIAVDLSKTYETISIRKT